MFQNFDVRFGKILTSNFQKNMQKMSEFGQKRCKKWPNSASFSEFEFWKFDDKFGRILTSNFQKNCQFNIVFNVQDEQIPTFLIIPNL